MLDVSRARATAERLVPAGPVSEENKNARDGNSRIMQVSVVPSNTNDSNNTSIKTQSTWRERHTRLNTRSYQRSVVLFSFVCLWSRVGDIVVRLTCASAVSWNLPRNDSAASGGALSDDYYYSRSSSHVSL